MTMDDTARNIGLNADFIRVQKGMTIHEFCEKSGMGLKAATSFFSGKGDMDLETMTLVSYTLGCHVGIIFRPKEERESRINILKSGGYIPCSFPDAVPFGASTVEIQGR